MAANRLLSFGDSITADPMSQAAPAGAQNSNWASVASILTGQRIQLVQNGGVAGNTTAQALARLPALLNPPVRDANSKLYAPNLLGILIGTNDGLTGLPLSGAQANIQSMVQLARVANVTPFLCTIPPSNQGATRTLAQMHLFINQLNSWLKEYAYLNGLSLVDFHSALVDPANGNYISGYQSPFDGVHPSGIGNQVMAATLNTALATQLPSRAPYLTESADDALTLLQTGGNNTGLFPSLSGGVPVGWSRLFSGTAITLTTNAAVKGKMVTLTRTDQVASDILYQDVTTGWSVGDKLLWTGVIVTSGMASGGGDYDLPVSFIGAAGTPSIDPVYNWVGVEFASPGIWYATGVVPPGTTSVRPLLISAPVGTGVLNIGQATLINLTSLGLG